MLIYNIKFYLLMVIGKVFKKNLNFGKEEHFMEYSLKHTLGNWTQHPKHSQKGMMSTNYLSSVLKSHWKHKDQLNSLKSKFKPNFGFSSVDLIFFCLYFSPPARDVKICNRCTRHLCFSPMCAMFLAVQIQQVSIFSWMPSLTCYGHSGEVP